MSSSARKEAAKAWSERTGEWEDLAKAQGIKMKPGEKIDPKDIRVEVGPPMTAEEFKAWMDRRKKNMKTFS